jgi:hypothetical protein
MTIIRVDKEIFEHNIKKYASISYWYLLLNDEKEPIKEMGFDENGNIVYKAPYKKDYGFFSDSPISFESIEDYEIIDESVFNTLWLES